MSGHPAARAKNERTRYLLRKNGYDDGYRGLVARSALAEYQTAYRRGREARAANQPGKDVA